MIGSFDVASVNLTLADPAGTAIPALTPAPGPFDLADFSSSVSLSNLKFYLEDGSQFVFGGLGDSPVLDPDLSVQEKGGATLQNGNSTLRFKSTTVGKRSAKRVLLLNNHGLGALTGVSAKRAGTARRDFKVTAKGGSTLAAGTGTQVEVVFRPKRPRKRSATLKLLSNDPDEPTFELGLSGKAKAAP